MCRNGHGMLYCLIKQILCVVNIGAFVGVPNNRQSLAVFVIDMLSSRMNYSVRT